MQAIYQPSGRALEYSLLACNLYTGCSHRCSYCFAPSCLHRTREAFHTNVQPRKGIIEQLRKDAPKFAGTSQRVLLCFHCDPYSPEAVASGVTREALEILREHDIPFQILTKGGTRACSDFYLYGPHDAFAATMTFRSESDSEQEEPGAALPGERMVATLNAHHRNIETWVSLEPVIDPAQSLEIIHEAHEYVDLYKIGVLNHDAARSAKIDWRAFGKAAIELCEKYGKRYYVKADLAKHLDGIPFTNTDTRTVTRKESRT
jgi:DNA repair photolyase